MIQRYAPAKEAGRWYTVLFTRGSRWVDVAVRVFWYPGVRRDWDSTHPFANGYGGYPLSWLSVLEGSHPLFF